MILSLRMHNLALIESLTMTFGAGLHVMTGETGAGKSIVVDAVNLVLGGRADRELIRTGTDKAWVEAEFDVSASGAAQALLAAQELTAEGGVATLYREISRSGRNLCRVCGVTMPVSFLKELAALLMDVHGQHEHQFLMDPRMHLAFLDASGDAAHQALLGQTAAAQEAFMACHRRYARLVRENDQKHFRMAELKKSLEELNKARLKSGEEEALALERDRFRHAEKIAAAVQTAYGAISAGEDSESLLTRLKTATDALKGLTALGEPYATLASRCESAYYELQELGYDLADMAEGGDFDPRRAEQVENRLDLIRRLERKYGDTVAEVLAHQEALQEEYDRFTSMDRQVADMGKEHKRLLAAYRALARQLTDARKALAQTFETRMMGELRDLGMEKTVFSVAFAAPPFDASAADCRHGGSPIPGGKARGGRPHQHLRPPADAAGARWRGSADARRRGGYADLRAEPCHHYAGARRAAQGARAGRPIACTDVTFYADHQGEVAAQRSDPIAFAIDDGL